MLFRSPAIDALRDLQEAHGFGLDDIQSVEVHGSKFVMDMVGRRYEPGDSPDVDAQFNLGRMYQQGRGVPRDLVRSLSWFRRAADQGDVEAQVVAAYRHLNGIGAEVNLERARYWFSWEQRAR